MVENIEEIWLTLRIKLRAFILSKVDDPSVADDILQDVFIKVHTKMDTLKDTIKIQSWIFQIANNLVMDHFRRNKRDILKNEIPDIIDDEPDNRAMAEAVEDMVIMMDSLPPEYCEALCLTELGNLSQKDYAEKAGISYPLARARVVRARQMLTDMLMQCCHYQFDKYGTVIDIHPKKCCCCCGDENTKCS